MHLLDELKPKIKYQNESDFDDNDDEYLPKENQFAKLQFYLRLYKRENALCCPKHAPLEKVERSSKIMATLFFVNLVIQGGSGFFFYYVYGEEKDPHPVQAGRARAGGFG